MSATIRLCAVVVRGYPNEEGVFTLAVSDDIARTLAADAKQEFDKARAELTQLRARIAELETDRDWWKGHAVDEGRSKLANRHELKLQERATQQLSAEVMRLATQVEQLTAERDGALSCSAEALAVLEACRNAYVETDGVHTEDGDTTRACELGEDCYLYTDDQQSIADAIVTWLATMDADRGGPIGGGPETNAAVPRKEGES